MLSKLYDVSRDYNILPAARGRDDESSGQKLAEKTRGYECGSVITRTLGVQLLFQEFLHDSVVIDICHIRAAVVQSPQHINLSDTNRERHTSVNEAYAGKEAASTHHLRPLEAKRLELRDVRPVQPRHRNLVPLRGLAGLPRDVLATPGAAGVHGCPIARSVLEAALAGHVVLRDLGVLGIAGLGRAEEGLEGNERALQREHRRPRVLEDVEADGARGRGHVRVVHLRDELHLHRLEGVVVGDRDVLRAGGDRVSTRRRGGGWGVHTTWKRPPSYGVSSGPSNPPMRWNGLSSTRSMVIFDDLSFLQSGHPARVNVSEGGFRSRRMWRTCNLLVHSA